MDFELPGELKLLRDMVRDFVKKALLPLEDQVEEADDVSPDLLRELRVQARDLGLLGLCIPKECGGAGMGMLANCVVREELGRTSLAILPLRAGMKISSRSVSAPPNTSSAHFLCGSSTHTIPPVPIEAIPILPG